MATHIYPVGRCIEGMECKAPEQQLRPTHKCSICKEIIHIICAYKNLLTDETYCRNCFPSSEGTSIQENNSGIDEISVNPTNLNCVISTITQSESDEDYRVIPRDYFITKDQKVNVNLQEKDADDWENLKQKVNNQIDSDLKTMMILKAQETGLEYEDVKTVQKSQVQNFGDIGLSWKCDSSHEQAVKVYEVMHGTFDDQAGYEYYMETSIMKKIKIKYEDLTTSSIKGCIARMIVNRKCVLTKLINKRAEKSHQKQLSQKGLRLRTAARKQNIHSMYPQTIIQKTFGTCGMGAFVMGRDPLLLIIIHFFTSNESNALNSNWRRKMR